jgi:hypothetical protein
LADANQVSAADSGEDADESAPTVRERALERFDADGDGRLDDGEREAIRKAGRPFAVKRPRYIRDRRQRRRIQKYDKDGDGELSKEEIQQEQADQAVVMAAWNKLVGEYAAFENGRAVVENLKRMERDAKEGKIENFPEELYEWIRSSIQRVEPENKSSGERRREDRHPLARFDIDENGRLDAAELRTIRAAIAGDPQDDDSAAPAPTPLPVVELQSTAPAQLRITEFMADNETGLVDEDGELADWIEIHNHAAEPRNLAGWSLSSSKKNSRKWKFPSVELGPGEYLVVLASGKDRRRPGRPLHTNFELKKSGELLSLTSPAGETFPLGDSQLPKQKSDRSCGLPVAANGEETAAVERLAFPTPGRRNTSAYSGSLSKIELSQPHGLFKESFALRIETAEEGVIVRYTTDGSRPDEFSPVFAGPLDVKKTTIIRACGYKAGHAPTPIVTRSYIFPADRVDDSADGLPPENYRYEWGAGSSNYGMDAVITSSAEHREQLVKSLWAIPSYSLVVESEDLFSDDRGIYAHAGWHGRKAERSCSLELLPGVDQREPGFQTNAGVRMRGGSSRNPRVQKHSFRMFFRKQYRDGKLKYDLFGDGGAQEFENFDIRSSQQYAWHHGFNDRALYVRDQLNRDLHLAMGHPSPRGNFRHLYINGHYWGLYNTCERPKASFGESYIGGDKRDFDVVKIMGGYSEDEDQVRRYQVAATDGNTILWERLNRLSQQDMSNLDNYCALLGLNPDGSRDQNTRRLVDPVNLIDYMLVLAYGGNLDSSISWWGGDRGANNWHGLINRSQNVGFQFIVWDAEHTMLELIEDRLGPFTMGTTADRGNPTWLYQRLLENEEFRMLVADRISKHFLHDGVLTPKRLTELFDRRVAEVEPALFGEAARWGNSSKTYVAALAGTPWQVEPRNAGVAKYEAWFGEVNRTRNEYIPQRTRVVFEQYFGRGLYPDLPEIEARWSTGAAPRLTLSADEYAIYYTVDGRDPRAFGGEVHRSARRYTEPVDAANGQPMRCRIRVNREWGPLREISPSPVSR